MDLAISVLVMATELAYNNFEHLIRKLSKMKGMQHLTIMTGEAGGRIFHLTDPRVTIGRELDNIVCIDDESLSRHHAELVADDDGYLVRDQESHNGTFVNDKPVAEARLQHGDLLRVGAVTLRYEVALTAPDLTSTLAPANNSMTPTSPEPVPASLDPTLDPSTPSPATMMEAPPKSSFPDKKLDDLRRLLSQSGLLKEARFDEAVQQRGGSTDSVIATLIKLGMVPEDRMLKVLSEGLRLELTRLGEKDVDMEVREKIPTKVVFQYNIMPMRVEKGTITIATNDPLNVAMIETVRMVSRCRVKLALATLSDIMKALKRYYGVGAETLDELIQQDIVDIDAPVQITKEDLESPDQEASVVKFVNQIIQEAFRERATDIHVEPMESDLRIRYRVDGVLVQAPVPPQLKRFQAAIISRIKVMANMDIAEKRLPQDGRINVRSGGSELDVRVSTIPTSYGESVSLRLLTRNNVVLGLDSIGLSPQDQKIVEKLVNLPHGIILVTGPTGSGKSTSIYSFLSTINSIDQRIITVEDPIEYELAGVNQIQVKPDIGLTFASGLRHILRQDPDVIMVGEIRDLETAEIGIRAALTGHLVFSTLHTNDAAGAVTRLLDMGIEPFLVSSSVEAIIAQRLVRTICESCKEEHQPSTEILREVGFPAADIGKTKFYRGRGCEECRYTGYKGRLGIFEVLIMSEALRPLVIERRSSTSIKQVACARGMTTLRDDGWDKVKRGITTLEEVARVTQEDESLSET
jgi:type II secretion system protein E